MYTVASCPSLDWAFAAWVLSAVFRRYPTSSVAGIGGEALVASAAEIGGGRGGPVRAWVSLEGFRAEDASVMAVHAVRG